MAASHGTRAGRPTRNIALAALLLATLGGAETATERRIELPGLGRGYLVIGARSPDPRRARPVLFSLHAFATKPEVAERAYALRDLAVERDLLLVVPEGRRNSQGKPFWNATLSCCDVERQAPDDVGYLRAVLSDLKGRYAVDSTRFYAFGVSNGAFMAYRWACTTGSELTGLVSVSGASLDPSDGPCTPGRPLRVLHLHGGADDVVQYDGGSMNGEHQPGARASVEAFRSVNGCASDAPPHTEQSAAPWALVASRSTWFCPRARLALWTVPNGGHQLRAGPRFARAALDYLEAE